MAMTILERHDKRVVFGFNAFLMFSFPLSYSSRSSGNMVMTSFFLLLTLMLERSVSESLVSYVIEPFDYLGHIQTNAEEDGLTLLNATSTDALFGKGAARIQLVEGVAEIRDIHAADEQSHNCEGAEYLSIWYKVKNSNTTVASTDTNKTEVATILARIALMDEDEDCGNATLFERFESEIIFLKQNGEWNELRWDFPLNTWKSVSGISRPLNMGHIRGWSVHVLKGNQQIGYGEIAEVLIDQLACHGGNDLFLAPFFNPGCPRDDKDSGYEFWNIGAVESELAMKSSDISFDNENGSMEFDYTVQQTKGWGGSTFTEHSSAAHGYFNLSEASSLILGYEIKVPSSAPGRVHMRFNLFDTSDCDSGLGQACRASHQSEAYYSFHYVLSDDSGQKNTTIELRGDSDANSPFWRTGWSGKVGNDRLDREYIKGYAVEISLDNGGEVNSTVTGSVVVGPIQLIASSQAVSLGLGPQCSEEKGLMFQWGTSEFRTTYYEKNCCELCDEAEDCVLAVLTQQRLCYVLTSLAPGSIRLARTATEMTSHIFHTPKRGNICSRCDCNKDLLTIDCRGSNLIMVPSYFLTTDGEEQDWKPKLLDLRENPTLLYLDRQSLLSVASKELELRLPNTLQYLSHDIIGTVKELTFEKERSPIHNIITRSTDFFGSVCCALDVTGRSSLKNGDAAFCRMDSDTIGSDTIFLPFQHVENAPELLKLRPKSPFMSEAALSEYMCAEYCKFSKECSFFEYDARKNEAEHTCRLFRSNEIIFQTVCCDEGDYTDSSKSKAGYISGRPPKTRHELYNARVVLAPHQLNANSENGYSVSYTLKLGSAPLRGAVWITPKVVSSTIAVTIHPPKIVLYDNETTATVSISVMNVDMPSQNLVSVVVNNAVESCDAAFEHVYEATENHVFINVAARKDETIALRVGISLTFLFLLAVFTLLILKERRRKKADEFWTVQQRELIFEQPVPILGRGTFGLVLLAEYRGTPVAVKRVLPPQSASYVSPFETSDGKEAAQNDVEVGTDSRTASRRSKKGLLSGGTVLSANRFSSLTTVSSQDDRSRLKADFIVEMRQLARLRHPCITTVMGAVLSDTKGDPMLVLEYMEHGSLYDLLHNDTVILEGELILPILRDIAQGARFLHAAVPKVIHGDLKAQNVLVDRKFRAKVADFGLSQKKQLGASGTPFWMAPELLRGNTCNTPESDAYSFGMILYEVYSRSEPYKDEDTEEVLRLVADPTVNKRPTVPAACPPKAQSLLIECLDADPQRRPTFEELDLQLKRVDVATLEPGELKASRRLTKDLSNDKDLLFEVFPKHIADAMRQGRKIEPESRDLVTVFFSDIIGFTSISSSLPALKVSCLLGRLYDRFDALSDSYDIFKVETIGDAYMAVTNLIHDQPDHAKLIANFAIDAIRAANETLVDLDDPSKGYVEIRVGFHSGPVVANVVGSRNPRYCLFGDTVNTASRMESFSGRNRIHCSESSAELLRLQDPERKLLSRGMIPIKGKGEMHTFWVNEE